MRLRIFILTVLLLAQSLASPAHAATQTRTSAFEYDASSGLLTKEIIEPDNPALCLATTYTYDAYGNKTSATTANCAGASGDTLIESRTSSSGFDAQGRFPTTSTNALNHSESKTYDARFGAVASLTGPNGLATAWTYDGFGRKESETRADGTASGWTYNLCGACPANGAYVVTQTATAAPTAKVYYDSLNREIRSETQGFDGGAVYKDTTYDALGRVAAVSRPYKSGESVYWMSFSYDLLGRVISETQPATAAGTVTTVTAYNGLTITVTVGNSYSGSNLPESLMQTKTTLKNSQGQTVSVTDAKGNVVNYYYDPFGNLTVTNAGGVYTALTYDLRGRKIAMSDPDMGNWSYAYDALGQLKRQTDAKGQVSTLAYDKLGRMVNRSEPDLVSSWTYDACTKGVGKLCTAASDNGYSRTLAYDTLGRVASVATVVDTSYSIGYAYDGNGRLAQTTYPTGFVARNVYTSLGYLWKVTDAGGSLYWQANSVSAMGKVLNETLGNGLTGTNTYDALERLTGNTVAGGGGTLQQFAYTYDTIGNLTQRVDAVDGNLTEGFVYDRLNRLTYDSGANLSTRAFGYDALGNMISKSDAGTYTYPGATNYRPHAVASIAGTVNGSFTYDANGNLTSGLARTLAYTSYNMPALVSAPNAMLPGTSVSYQYTYNAEHERVRHIINRVDGAITTIYLHPAGKGQLLYEKEVKGGVTEHKHYLSAGSQLIGVYLSRSDSSTETRYFHHDHLGSLTLITNASGGQIERLAYEAFGKRRFPAGPSDPNNTLYGITTDRGFTSHEHLDEMGLIHMNGRVYDPTLGRFMTADPFVQNAGDLQSYNRYSYAWNSPLGYVDPTGYWNLGSALSSAWKDVWHSDVGRAAVTVAVAYFTGQWVGDQIWASIAAAGPPTASSIVGMNIAAGASGGFSGGFVGSGGDFQAGLNGAASGGLFGLAGSVGGPDDFSRYAAHAGAGCVQGELGGGGCGGGAASAVAGKWVTNATDGNFIATVVAGGTVSAMGGGRFVNGASSAAFGYLFNYCAHNGCWVTDEEKALMRSGRTGEGYALMCRNGDRTACEFGKVARNEGLTANLSNVRLETSLVSEGAVRTRFEAQKVIGSIRVDIGNGYVDSLEGATPSNPMWPSRSVLRDLHRDVFRSYGAANGFGGNISDLPLVRRLWGYDWCPNCKQ